MSRPPLRMIVIDPIQSASPEEQLPRRMALPSKRTLDSFLSEACAAVRLKGEVSVLLSSDETIRDLNRRFRKKNKATDVLSFPSADPSIGIAGDLAISIDTARRQAEAFGHSLREEIKILMLHGALHLAGYDHEIDEGQMGKKEALLRKRFGLPLGLIQRAGESEPKSPVAAKARATKKALPTSGRSSKR